MNYYQATERISSLPVICLISGITVGIVTPKGYDSYITICAFGLALTNVILWLRPRYRLQTLHRLLLMVNFAMFGLLSYHINSTDIAVERGDGEAYGYIDRYARDNEERTSAAFNAERLRVNNKLYTDIEGTAYFSDEIDLVVPGEYYKIFGTVDRNSRDSTVFRFYVERFKKDTTQLATIPSAIYHLREWTETALIKCGYDNENIGLLLALILGDKSKLDYKIRQDFSDCGIVHILAVSGLHVGIIYMFISFIIKIPFRRKPVMAALLILLLLWTYAIITGLAPSIVRATLMMSIYEIVRLGKRKTNPLSTLYVTLFLILAIWPEHITSIGLWLSFAAVWGILLFYRPVSQVYQFRFPPFRYIHNSLTLSLVAQTATAPIILLIFGTFPNLFLISNLLTVPLIAPIIIGSIIAMIATPINITAAEMIAAPVDDLLTFVRQCAHHISSLDYSITTDIKFSITECILFLLSLYFLKQWLNEGGHRNAIITTSLTLLLVIAGVY